MTMDISCPFQTCYYFLLFQCAEGEIEDGNPILMTVGYSSHWPLQQMLVFYHGGRLVRSIKPMVSLTTSLFW